MTDRRIPLILLASSLAWPAIPVRAEPRQAAMPKNAILVGWDGASRDHVVKLLAEGRLPNLKRLLDKGGWAETEVTTGNTQTKPGWAEILTGYSAVRLGITSNKVYRPIPKGYTVFDRLKSHFGADAVATLFIAGKGSNVGARGPHVICLNAKSRDPNTHQATLYLDKTSFTGLTEDGGPPVWVAREGEPYFHASKEIDHYRVGLGGPDRVGAEVLEALAEYRDKRFFGFFHFGDPDDTGHIRGENSQEYDDAIRAVDSWLGRIMDRLKSLGIDEETAVYVTSDHGMDKDGFQHNAAPHTFLATNSKRKLHNGDRKDITPTLLEGFGVSLDKIDPQLDGGSLFAAEIDTTPLRIGYFLGGRTSILMRISADGEFDANGVQVDLYTKNLRDSAYHILTRELLESDKSDSESKATGIELTQGLFENHWDLASIGESSFLAAVAAKQPVMAIAELGHDVKGLSGHLFALHKGVSISTTTDYRGKLFVSRRAGPGDAAFLLEYLQQEGVDAARDILELDHVPTPEERSRLPKDKVLVVHKVFEDDLVAGVHNGVIDGGFFHLKPYESLQSFLNIVKPLHAWANPEMSQAVLICRKDWLRDQGHRKRFKAFLRAYISRIRHEHTLTPQERTAEGTDRWRSLDSPTRGLNYPQYDDIPAVHVDILYDVIKLLEKHHQVDFPAMKLEPYIDNTMVFEVAAQLSQGKP